MNFPDKICFKDKGPKGGKLTAWVVGDDLPTSIQVKGTNDVTAVKKEREKDRGHEGNDYNDRCDRDRERDHCRSEHNQRRQRYAHSGHGGHGGHDDDDDDDDDYNNCFARWESKNNKYTTLKQTLIMIKNGVVVGEYNYDEKGNLIVEVAEATISNASIVLDDKDVSFSWKAEKEVKIAQYNSQHKLPGSTTWNTFHIDRPLGNGSVYSAEDTPTVAGTHDYRLTVAFTDTTPDKILLTQSINVAAQAPINDATLASFTVVPNADFGDSVHLEWKTIIETNVVEFRYDRQKPGEADYAPIDNPIAVQGAGAIYSVDDFVAGTTGTILYRLKAVFPDGSFKIIGVQSVDIIL